MNPCLLVLLQSENEHGLTNQSVAESWYETCSRLPYEKLVLYASEIDSGDLFSDGRFSKELQSAGDEGFRIAEAFRTGFERGFERVVVLRGYYPELGPGHVVEAFERLLENDAVCGPGDDGRYYLIGLKRFMPELFKGKEWSGNDVFLDTLIDLKSAGCAVAILDPLDASMAEHEGTGMSKSRF